MASRTAHITDQFGGISALVHGLGQGYRSIPPGCESLGSITTLSQANVLTAAPSPGKPLHEAKVRVALSSVARDVAAGAPEDAA